MKELRLRVFENRFLRIFGPERDEVTGEWRKLHNEDLQNLYSSPNIIRQIKSRRMGWAGHVVHVGEESVQGFGGKVLRKKTTRKNQNGSMEIGWGLWSGFSLSALGNTAMNFCVMASRSCGGHICLSVLLFLCFKNKIFCQMIN
jgi:hypothetical protein